MDRRLIFPGGEVGITQDELDLMPNSNRGGIFAIAEGISEGADYIISGVNAVITPGVSCQVQDGFVFLNGEVLKVDAATIAKDGGVTGDVYQFVKVSNNADPGYNRNYRNQDVHNVAEINRAVPVNVTTAAQLPVDGPKLNQVLAGILQVQSDWNQSDSGQPDFIKNKPIIEDIRNVGEFQGWNISSGTPGTTTYPASGNLISATLTGIDGNESRVTVVWDTPMDDLNYRVDISIRSLSSNIKDDGQIRQVVWKPLSTTSALISIGETFGASQSLMVFVKAVQL